MQEAAILTQMRNDGVLKQTSGVICWILDIWQGDCTLNRLDVRSKGVINNYTKIFHQSNQKDKDYSLLKKKTVKD